MSFNPDDIGNSNLNWIDDVENYANGNNVNTSRNSNVHELIDIFRKGVAIGLGTAAILTVFKFVAPDALKDKQCQDTTSMPVKSGDIYQDVVKKAEDIVTEKDGGTRPAPYLMASYIGNLNSDTIWDYEKFDGRPVVVADGIKTITIAFRCNS